MQQKPILQRSRVCPAPCRTAAVCKRAAAGGMGDQEKKDPDSQASRGRRSSGGSPEDSTSRESLPVAVNSQNPMSQLAVRYEKKIF